MKRSWQSLAEVREPRQDGRVRGTINGATRQQSPIAVPPVIFSWDKQESMRLTLDWMVKLNGGHSVAITIPAVEP